VFRAVAAAVAILAADSRFSKMSALDLQNILSAIELCSLGFSRDPKLAEDLNRILTDEWPPVLGDATLSDEEGWQLVGAMKEDGRIKSEAGAPLHPRNCSSKKSRPIICHTKSVRSSRLETCMCTS
jgi:hypothetical protein